MRTMERAAFFAALGSKKLKGVMLLRHRRIWQCLDPHGGGRAEQPQLGLWRVPRHRSTVPAAAHRNRPREARDDAASDPENPDRADAVCADLRLLLAERARAARRGGLADED